MEFDGLNWYYDLQFKYIKNKIDIVAYNWCIKE